MIFLFAFAAKAMEDGDGGGEVGGAEGGGGGRAEKLPKLGRKEVVLEPREDPPAMTPHCDGVSERTTWKNPCFRMLSLGMSVRMSCHWNSVIFWPRDAEGDWRDPVDGRVCAHPPLGEQAADGLVFQPCSTPVKWSKFGAKVYPASSSDGNSTDYTITLPKNRPASWGTVTDIYGMCVDPQDSQPLFWKLRLIPEPIPSFFAVPYVFDDKAIDDGSYKYVVNLYRGDSLDVRFESDGETDPWNAFNYGGAFCPIPVELPFVCTTPEFWETVGLIVHPRPTGHSALLATNIGTGIGEPKDTYVRWNGGKKDILFQLRQHWSVPSRFLHAHYYEKGFHQCHPADGPTYDKPCDGGVVDKGGIAYINCTGLESFDPPDINTPDGSFCTEEYTDSAAPCRSTKKWSEIFTKPQVRSENELFTAYNGGHNLMADTTVYGRCGDKEGSVLFFKYTFGGSAAIKGEDEAVVGEVKKEGRELPAAEVAVEEAGKVGSEVVGGEETLEKGAEEAVGKKEEGSGSGKSTALEVATADEEAAQSEKSLLSEEKRESAPSVAKAAPEAAKPPADARQDTKTAPKGPTGTRGAVGILGTGRPGSATRGEAKIESSAACNVVIFSLERAKWAVASVTLLMIVQFGGL